jgi:beta-fructofuranosidase
MWYDDEKEIYFQISGNKPSSNNKPILYSGNDYKLPLKEVGSFMAYDMPDVEAHEDISCPDFFKLQDKWVLVLISHSRGARYYIGEWKDNKFFPESHKRINFPGGPIFAPETLLDDKGRRIMWAWLYDGKTRENIKNKGVSDGVMSMPRVLSLSKDKMSLRMKPPKEIENLRYNYSTVNNEFILEPNKNLFLENIKGNSIELYVEIDSKKAKKFGLNVLSSRDGNEHTKIFIDKDQSLLGIDVSRSSAQNPKYSQYMMIKGDEYKNKTTKVQSAPFKINDGEIIKLRIFIDKSIIEVFANDGMQSITQVVFPTNEDSVHVELFSDDSEIIVKKINSWSLFPSMQW